MRLVINKNINTIKDIMPNVDFKKKFFLIFLFSILLFYTSFSFSLEINDKNKSNNDIKDVLKEKPLLSETINECTIKALKKEDARKFFDKILVSGFRASRLASNEPAKKDRAKLDTNVLFIPDENMQTAIKQDINAVEFSLDEISYLFNSYWENASFSFGIKLNDSVRIARCNDNNLSYCAINQKAVHLRNSSGGILKEAVWVPTEEIIGTPASKTFKFFKSQLGLNKKDEIKTALEMQFDHNESHIKLDVIKRKYSKKPISSIISTDNYEASFTTDCADPNSCLVLVYSAFDKYFNLFYSFDFVYTNVGPVFLTTVKSLRGKLPKSLQKLPLQDKFSEIINKFKEPLTRKWRKMKFKQYGDYWLERADALTSNFDVRHVNDLFYKDLKLTNPPGSFIAKLDNEFESGAISALGSDLSKARAFGEVVALKKKYLDDFLDTIYPEFAEKIRKIDTLSPDEVRKLYNEIMPYLDTFEKKFGADIKEYIIGNHFQGYYVKYTGMHGGADAFVDIASGPGKKNVFAKIGEEGIPSKWKAFELEGKDLVLYRLEAISPLRQNVPADPTTLKNILSSTKSKSPLVVVIEGNPMPLTDATVDDIVKLATEKGYVNLDIFKGGYKKFSKLSAEDLVKYTVKNFDDVLEKRVRVNLNNLYEQLTTRDWFPFRVHGPIDYYLKKQMDIFRSMGLTGLSPKALSNVLTFHTVPLLYWHSKRAFGFSGWSMYRLPKTFSFVKIYQGMEEIYKDSYLDIFSNEGSDTGDIMQKVFASPIFFLYDITEVWQKIKTSPVGRFIMKFRGIWPMLKPKPGDVALYFYTDPSCQDCSLSIKYKGKSADIFFNGSALMQGIVFEATKNGERDKKGQTVVGFVHHSNLLTDKGEINLVKALANKEDCATKEENLKTFFLVPIGKINKFVFGSGEGKVGFTLGVTENLLFYYFQPWNFWAAFVLTMIQQVYVAKQLDGCVDTREGYYIHFIKLPFSEKESKEKDKVKNMNDVLSKTEKLVRGVLEDKNSVIAKRLEEANLDVEKMIKNLKVFEAIELQFSLKGKKEGKLNAVSLFTFWVSPNAKQTIMEYDENTIMHAFDGNNKLTIDKTTGILKLGGKAVINSPDHVRLSSIDLSIPAIVIPHKLILIPLNDNNSTLFRIDNKGNVYVEDESALNCINKGLKELIGQELDGKLLSFTLGKAKKLAMEKDGEISYITFTGDGSSFLGEYKATIGKSIIISNILMVNNKYHFVALKLENAVFIYKPKTNYMILWIMDLAKTQGENIKALKAKLENTKNEITNCPEPAISFKVTPKDSSELVKYEMDKLNKALDNVGPFKYFETPTRIFVFYSKLEEGKCKDYLKIINKRTGQVEVDQEISSINQSPDGSILITTKDGKVHSLKFSSKGGRPILEYNGKKETLLMAQGTKGSFYYNPTDNSWNVKNAHLIPMDEGFKEKGLLSKVDASGKVVSEPGNNPININIGKEGEDRGIFLDLHPDFAVFIILIFLTFTAILLTRWS